MSNLDEKLIKEEGKFILTTVYWRTGAIKIDLYQNVFPSFMEITHFTIFSVLDSPFFVSPVQKTLIQRSQNFQKTSWTFPESLCTSNLRPVSRWFYLNTWSKNVKKMFTYIVKYEWAFFPNQNLEKLVTTAFKFISWII